MSKKNWTLRTIKVSKKYNAEQRRAIAAEIVDHIKERTKAGKGKGGQSWTPPADKYSKEYKESLDFKFKADKSKVNLTLTGDMLDSIKLLGNKEGEITIGIPKSDIDYGKAEGNIRGSYGKSRGSSSKARDFMSISGEEKRDILQNFPTGKSEEDRESIAERVAAYQAALAAAKKITGTKRPTLGQLELQSIEDDS